MPRAQGGARMRPCRGLPLGAATICLKSRHSCCRRRRRRTLQSLPRGLASILLNLPGRLATAEFEGGLPDVIRRLHHRSPPARSSRAGARRRRHRGGRRLRRSPGNRVAGQGGDRARNRTDQGRHPAFALRHDGDQRVAIEGRHADADRGAEQKGRRDGPQARGGGGRSGLQLAAVRREGEAALVGRQGRGGVRLLDLGVAQIGAAGVRAAQRHPALSGPVRGPGVQPQRLLYRRGAKPAGDPGGRLSDEPGGGDALGARRHRLRLPAHHQQDPRSLSEGEGRRAGRHHDQLHPVRLFRLAGRSRQDQGVRLGRQEDRGGLDDQRRRQRAVLQGARQPGHQGDRHPGRRVQRRRAGTGRHRHQAAARPSRRVELFPERRHALEQGSRRRLQGLREGRQARLQRPDGGALHRLQHVGEGGREGRLDRSRRGHRRDGRRVASQSLGRLCDDDAEPSSLEAGADRRSAGQWHVQRGVADPGPRRGAAVVALPAGKQKPDRRLAAANVVRQLRRRRRQVPREQESLRTMGRSGAAAGGRFWRCCSRGAMAAALLLSVLAPGGARAAGSEPADPFAALAATNFDLVAQGVQALAVSGNRRAAAVIDALRDGKLYAWKWPRPDAPLYIRADQGFVDARSGEPSAAPPSPVNLRRIIVNDSVRAAIERAEAALGLFAAERAPRRKAAEALFQSGDPAALPLIERALASEKDPGVARVLREARAVALLKSGSTEIAARIAAVHEVAARADLAARNTLASLQGQPPPVAAAIQGAIRDIDQRLQLWGLLENLYYGVSLGAVLLLAAAGLAITFGVMGVINMAHGEMVMIGAYTTFVVQRLVVGFAPALDQFGLIFAVPAAFLVAGMLGVVIERCLIRFLYGRPLETLLATWGLSLILQQAVRSIFGSPNKEVSNPSWMTGGFDLVGGFTVTWNRLYIIVFCFVVLGVLALILNRTTFRLQMRAVTQNREMARAMGIRTARIDALTFGLGSGIAGMAGVALSQIGNVSPNLGQIYIVDSFLVVVFGGVGNLLGTLVGALSLGVVNKLLEPVAGAILGKIVVLVAIILFIQRRPRGLFALKGRTAEG